MKFYLDHFKSLLLSKIKGNKLNAVHINLFTKQVQFFKSGLINNGKNAAILFEIEYGYKYRDKFFYLNDKYYGDNEDFTKHSWRRFCKLKAFL
jgi:hypothetical protein